MRTPATATAIAVLAVGLIALGLSHAASTTGRSADEAGEVRLTPQEFDFTAARQGGTGTSGVAGIQTLVLKGDPDQPGLYTILLKIPPDTRIRAHAHPDDRVATVVAGEWRLGYGDRSDVARLKALPPGSFYTETAGRPHFAQTRDSEVVLMITGIGPSGLHYTEESP